MGQSKIVDSIVPIQWKEVIGESENISFVMPSDLLESIPLDFLLNIMPIKREKTDYIVLEHVSNQVCLSDAKKIIISESTFHNIFSGAAIHIINPVDELEVRSSFFESCSGGVLSLSCSFVGKALCGKYIIGEMIRHNGVKSTLNETTSVFCTSVSYGRSILQILDDTNKIASYINITTPYQRGQVGSVYHSSSFNITNIQYLSLFNITRGWGYATDTIGGGSFLRYISIIKAVTDFAFKASFSLIYVNDLFLFRSNISYIIEDDVIHASFENCFTDQNNLVTEGISYSNFFVPQFHQKMTQNCFGTKDNNNIILIVIYSTVVFTIVFTVVAIFISCYMKNQKKNHQTNGT